MRQHWLKKGLSLIEILGVTTVVMTVASVAVISVKDSLKAGQRSAVQRELQSLNTALNNFKAAGGVIDDGSLAENAVRKMRDGVGVSDLESFVPLTEDPDWLKEIDGETYRLDYNEKDGFTYVPDSGAGPAFSDGGRETTSLGPGAFDFDPSNREAALAALNGLGALNSEDPNFGSGLDALNAAYAMGTLTDADMLAAGLVKYGNEWMTPGMAQANHAQDAWEALAAGGSWNTLNADQQRAYASAYPEAAVQVGRGSALDLMDPAILTPDLVKGYAKIGSGWIAPQSTSINTKKDWVNGTLTDVPSDPTLTYPSFNTSNMSTPHYIYVQTDPLKPPLAIGYVTGYHSYGPYGIYYGILPSPTTTYSSWNNGGTSYDPSNINPESPHFTVLGSGSAVSYRSSETILMSTTAPGPENQPPPYVPPPIPSYTGTPSS
jgi:type II secretory pathway pseudopilin PulG